MSMKLIALRENHWWHDNIRQQNAKHNMEGNEKQNARRTKPCLVLKVWVPVYGDSNNQFTLKWKNRRTLRTYIAFERLSLRTFWSWKKTFWGFVFSRPACCCGALSRSGSFSAESYKAFNPSPTVRSTAFAKEYFRRMNNKFRLTPLTGPRHDPVRDARYPRKDSASTTS